MVPVVAWLALLPAASAGGVDLILPGALLDRSTATALRPAEGRWMALLAEPAGVRLLATPLSMITADDPLDEGNDAVLFSAELRGEPIAYLRGAGLPLGPVRTTVADPVWTSYEEPTILGEDSQGLTRLVTRAQGPEASRVELLRTRTGAGRRQSLAEEARGQPMVRWAGDLDADGAPDLLLDVDPGTGNEMRLYLSSAAAPGELMGLVGRFVIPGC